MMPCTAPLRSFAAWRQTVAALSEDGGEDVIDKLLSSAREERHAPPPSHSAGALWAPPPRRLTFGEQSGRSPLR